MGIATYSYNRSTSGGEIIRELVNASDGQGLHFANGAALLLAYASGGVFGTADFSIEFILDQDADNSSDNEIYTSQIAGSNVLKVTNSIGSNVVRISFDSTNYDIAYDMSGDYGTPTHYVLTCDRSALATLYKNGNSVGTIDISGSSAVNLGNGNTANGYLGGVSGYGVIGTYYRWRTWKKLLSAAEVTACYENASVPITDQWSNCVTDLDLAFANPEMSLQIQSRSGAGDATASVGVSQVTPIEAVNTNKLAVGGTTPRVGIGVPAGTIPAQPFTVSNSGAQGVEISAGATSYIQAYNRSGGDYCDLKIDAQTLAFGTDTGATRLSIDSAGLTTVTNPGWPLKNEISNSGFDVWSNSTLVDVGSDLAVDGTFSDTANWTEQTGWAVTGGKAVATSAASGQQLYQARTYTIGKLYRVVFEISGYSAGGIKWAGPGTAGVNTVYSANGTHTFVFESDAATSTINFITDGTTTLDIEYVTLYEVTPGCVAGDALAMDGWYKNMDNGSVVPDIFREQPSTSSNTKDGSYYSLKYVGSSDATSSQYVSWPGPAAGSIGSKAQHYLRFQGRTATLGCWVKTTDATAKVFISDSDGTTNSTAHTGGGGTPQWEWLEVTRTSDSSITNWYAKLGCASNATSTTIYFSQPMLVFGSAIGAGNYSRPSGEIVNCEAQITIYDDIALLATDDKILNLEALSNGKIPKGAKAVYMQGWAKDSGSAGTDCYLHTRQSATSGWGGSLNPAGLTNDDYARVQIVQPCNSDGDIQYFIEATGSGTFDTAIGYRGVQLR